MSIWATVTATLILTWMPTSFCPVETPTDSYSYFGFCCHPCCGFCFCHLDRGWEIGCGTGFGCACGFWSDFGSGFGFACWGSAA